MLFTLRGFKPNLITLLLFPFCVSAASPWQVTDGSTLQVTADYATTENNDSPLLATGDNSKLIVNPGLSFTASADGTYVAYVKDHARLELTNNILDAQEGILLAESTLDISGGSVTTRARGAWGITARDSAEVVMNGTQLVLNGVMNRGISMADSTLNARDVGIRSTMRKATGMNLYNTNATLDNVIIELDDVNAANGISLTNSLLTANNLNIRSASENAPAIMMSKTAGSNILTLTNSRINSAYSAFRIQGGDVDLDNVAIHTTLRAGYGLNINSDSLSHMRGGSVLTEGEYADAVHLAGATTRLEAEEVTFRTEGDRAIAVNAALGTAKLSNSYLRTYGDESRGIYTTNKVEGDNLVITTAGNKAYGVSAYNGEVALQDSTVTTSGTGALGLYAMMGAAIYANNVEVITSGESAYALASALGKLDIHNSKIITTGDAAALYAQGSDTALTNAITLDNVSLYSEQHAAIQVEGASPMTLQLQNGTVVKGGNGQALVVLASAKTGAPSTVNLSASDNVQLLGDITTGDPANIINLSLSSRSRLEGVTQNVNQLAIDESSLWSMTGDSTLNTLNHTGQLFFNPAGGFKTLRIKDALTGSGQFTMNVKLGDSRSPADRLSVAGDASGQFHVAFNNVGGSGALAEEGIPVISVAGEAGSATFKQTNTVVAGNYEYFLNKVSEHDWYLQSSYTPVPVPPVEPVEPAEPVDPVEPVMPDEDRESLKTWRPETAGYLMASAMNAAYGFTSAGTYQQRLGARQEDRAAWGRIYSRHDRNEAGRFGNDVNSSFVQLGGDVLKRSLAEGWQLTAGPTLTLGQQRSSNRDEARRLRTGLSAKTGKTRTSAYGVGGYVTASHENGSYLDIVGQLTRYSNRFSSVTSMQQDSYGVVLSAEVGKPLALTDRVKLEPQLQLMGQSLNVSQTEAGGVKLNDQNQFIGQARGGLRLFYDHDRVQPYLKLDFVRQLGKTPGIRMNGEILRPDLRKNIGQAGAGISGKISQNLNLYAEGEYTQSFGRGSEGYSGNLGLKYHF